MYYISDRRSAVREIQKYLSAVYGKTRHISESGAFDTGTRDAVVDFQTKEGLNPTGRVDSETFSALYRKYKSEENKRTAKKAAPFISFPIKRNDLSEEIRIISKKAANLLDYYGVYHALRPSPIFTKEAAVCIRKLRQIYKLPDDEIIDEELYLRMSEDHRRLFSEE